MSSSALKSINPAANSAGNSATMKVVRKAKPLPLVRTKIYRKRREVGTEANETALLMTVIAGGAAIISTLSLGYWMIQSWGWM